eukprot:1145945-Pelagomonas_calceolata.AAC.1
MGYAAPEADSSTPQIGIFQNAPIGVPQPSSHSSLAATCRAWPAVGLGFVQQRLGCTCQISRSVNPTV